MTYDIPPASAPLPLDRVQGALTGNNEVQARIAQIGLEWLDLLLRKNADYGCAVWEPPILSPRLAACEAILVRMSDKIKRLQTLQGQKGQVAIESYEDTMRDLGAYCLLWLARPDAVELKERGITK